MGFWAGMKIRSHFGMNWNNGVHCSSRSANSNNSALNLNSNNAGRGVSETKGLTLRLFISARLLISRIHDRVPRGLVGLPEVRGGFFLKRHGNLWDKVTAIENIEEAYRRAKRGKGWQRTVKEVEKDKDNVLAGIRESLLNHTFTTADYRMMNIWEPKHRVIYALPFNPDRIVQHAVMAVVAPIWNRMFDSASHACRPGFGQHSASRKAMEFVRKYQYVMHADVRKFYPSINQTIAMNIIEKKIKDADVLWLLRDIINSFPGEKNVPIGNLTSQWVGNLYLNELDTFIRAEITPPGYLRYNDDFLIFGNDKRVLRDAQETCRIFLKDRLGLTMAKDRIYPTECGVDFVGYRHFPKKILVRKRTARKIQGRIQRLKYEIETKQITMDRARSVIASTKGWLRWAQSYNLETSLGLNVLQERVITALQNTAQEAI